MRSITGAALALGLLAVPAVGPASAQDASATELFPGETIRNGAGFPAIAWYQAGEADKPLLVFVPGAHHTARVFYGGHEGASPDDFLASAIAERGYPMLALSYPIDTAESGLTTDHPDFMIRDWGRQTAEIAAGVVAEEGLAPEAVVVAWSMGGKVAQSVHAAFAETDVTLRGFISLAATPALPGMIAITREYPMLPSGYADRRKNFDGWYGQVASNGEAQGRAIVPEDVFKAHYQGDIPINLQGYGQQFRDGAYVMDVLATQEDARPFQFGEFPLVGAIIPNGRGDRRHALVDEAAWALYNANTIFKRYLTGNDVDVKTLDDASWEGLVALTRGIDERLSRPVEGNHFFFMGAEGAEATAKAIDSLVEEFAAVKSDLSQLLGVEIR